MATKTTNYALTKPEANDYYNVNDFNSNADIIDAELKKLASGKADLDEGGKIPAAQLPSAVTVDSEINTESENPVQNKVIAAKLAKKADLDEAGKIPAAQLPKMDYAASQHEHTAAEIRAGTFPDAGMVAKTGTDYTTARIRNIQASTADLTAGTSELANGNIYLVYE